MREKRVNKSQKLKIFVAVLSAIAIVGLIAITSIINREEENKYTIGLGNDLYITDIDSYDGEFLEDGKDAPVSNVLMFEIENRGSEAVEYAVINAQIGETKAEFSVTALMPGAKAIILEKNQMQYDASVDYTKTGISCSVLARYQYPLTKYEDKLEIQVLDDAVNVKNISKEDILQKIAIVYKNKEDGVYQGGIAYRVIIEDGIKSGEISQKMASHLDKKNSEILFVTMMDNE